MPDERHLVYHTIPLIRNLFHVFLVESRALTLLPLPKEYEIKELLEACKNNFALYDLQTSPSKPPLQMLTIAESLNLEELRVKMVDGCAKKITLTQLDSQRKLEENAKLTDTTYHQVIRSVESLLTLSWVDGRGYLMSP